MFDTVFTQLKFIYKNYVFLRFIIGDKENIRICISRKPSNPLKINDIQKKKATNLL